MTQLTEALLSHANPIKLMETLDTKTERLLDLMAEDTALAIQISDMERDLGDIEFDLRGVINSMNPDELKDPKTGRTNANHTQWIWDNLCRSNADWVDVDTALVRLTTRRKELTMRLRQAEVDQQAVRYKVDLVAACVGMINR